MPLIDMPDFSTDLLAEFAARRTERVNTPVIQPAEPFLDMAGEDLRRRIFLTESETGANLCLRPEFTIPVCLRHIETATGTPKRYSYLGEVFRQRREGSHEFYQAGIEDLGDKDIASSDARAIGDATGILKALLPGRKLALTLGDQAVFEAVVKALGLPFGWQRRLIHAFGDMAHLEASAGAARQASAGHRPRSADRRTDRFGQRGGSRRPHRPDHAGNRLFHQCQPFADRDREKAQGKAGTGRNPAGRHRAAAAARIPDAAIAARRSARRARLVLPMPPA
jgi:ATP phosphoribosyltransferase regulatory subunit HisZ